MRGGWVRRSGLHSLSAAHGTVLPLSEGSAVRLTGSGQQWVVPIADGDRVAELIRERVPARTSSEVSTPTAEQWRAAMRKRELIRKSGTGKGVRAPSDYRSGFILFTALAVASFDANEGWVDKSAGALVFGIGAVGCLMAWRNAAAVMRLAEEWPQFPADGQPSPPQTRPWTSSDGR